MDGGRLGRALDVLVMGGEIAYEEDEKEIIMVKG
jgi:hypothetical protein